MSRRWLPVLVLPFGVCLVSTALPAASSGAAPPAPARPVKSVAAQGPLTGADRVLALNQDAVDKVADALNGLAESPVGTTVDPDRHTVTAFYRGRHPVGAQEIAADAARSNVHLVFAAAKNDKGVLQRARALMEAQPGVTSVATSPDGGTLRLGVTAAANQARLRALSAVQLDIAPMSPRLFSRWADTLPFWGGAAIVNTSGYCSTGFGVHKTDNSEYFMLTADHCRFGGLQKTPTGVVVGNNDEWDSDRDVDEVNTDYGRQRGVNTGAVVHTDGTDPTGGGAGESFRLVRTSASSNVGDILCTSGAFSGMRCNLKVVNTNTTVHISATTIYYNELQLEQVNHTNGAGEGDSGGPVFYLRPDGYVGARGLVSAGDTSTTVPCTGVQNRVCSWRIFAANLPIALNVLHLNVNTAP